MLKLIKKIFFNSSEKSLQKTIKDLLESSIKKGKLNRKTSNLIEGALSLEEGRVQDIMHPRSQLVFLSLGQKFEEMIDIVIKSAHSRFPVFDACKEQIVGFIVAKDLLKIIVEQKGTPDLRQILRQPYFAPSSKKLTSLLNDFQHRHDHLALIHDEHGELEGFITIEDILEEIVGDIADEHDKEEEHCIFSHGDSLHYTVKASTNVELFNEKFSTSFDLDRYHTIGGWVIDLFGYIPKKGESIEYKDLHITIIRSDPRTVHLLKVIKREKKDS
jgi:magnesium and cobalt transporter